MNVFQYDVMNYMQFPEKHWKKIRTINMMERTNKELKRKAKGWRANFTENWAHYLKICVFFKYSDKLSTFFNLRNQDITHGS